MLTAAELAQARADVLETLVSVVVIQRLTTTIDDSGLPSEAWNTIDTVMGRIDNIARMSGGEMIVESEKGKTYYQLTIEWDAEIQDGDQISIGGLVYELKQIHEAQDLRIVKRGIIVLVLP